MRRAYLIPWNIHKFAIELCRGSCGRATSKTIGVNFSSRPGAPPLSCIVCYEPSCPWEDGISDKPVGNIEGSPAFMRKLNKPLVEVAK